MLNDLGALNFRCGSMQADVMELQTSLSALAGVVIGQVLQALPDLLGTTISDKLRPALQDSMQCVVPPMIEKMIQKKLFDVSLVSACVSSVSSASEVLEGGTTAVPKSKREFIDSSNASPRVFVFAAPVHACGASNPNNYLQDSAFEGLEASSGNP